MIEQPPQPPIAEPAKCETVACHRRVHRKRAVRWLKREHPWKYRWRFKLSKADRSWATSTGSCESGNNPTAHSPLGDHGAMQFKLGTWHAAGGTGDPHTATIYEQWVRAVWWRNRTSRNQWPVCG